jgi:hypothetical protein
LDNNRNHLKGRPTFFASIPGHSSERFDFYDIFGRKVGNYEVCIPGKTGNP